MLTFIGTGAIIGIVIGVLILLLVVILISWFIKTFNKLVKSRNKVRNSFSQIDVQLKRRFDLIPNLVETVKGYANHEKSILEEFAKARQIYQGASASHNVNELAEANNMISNTLSRLLVVQEQYPALKADAQFNKMMSELRDSEDKISYARQFYNDVVLQHNNLVEMFPSSIVANMRNFKTEEFFKANESERENVKVQF